MRRRYVKVPAEVVADMFREHPDFFYTRVKHGIPLDAKLINCGQIGDRDDVSSPPNFFFTFEHDSFPEISKASISEPFNVTVCTIHGMTEA